MREGVEHLHTEEDKEVANSGGTQPQTLADTLQMLRSNLRHERETQGRDKQLSHRQEEVGQYQYRRTRLHSHLGCLGQGFEIFARGVVVGNCDADEEDVCAGGDEHTDGYLARGGNFFAFACQGGEYPHDDGGKNDDKERVDALQNLRRDGAGVDKVAGKDGERLGVLVEREPEEDCYAEHGIESIHALLDLLGVGLTLFGGVVFGLGTGFFNGVGQTVFNTEEDEERDEHGQH